MNCQSLLVGLFGICACAVTAGAAEPKPAKAPEQTQCKFSDHTDVTIEYESMQRNGRKIFGGVVPFGKAWEMGTARPATFVTGANLLVEGKEVPAGRYSLFTIPDADSWTLVIKKASGKDDQGQTTEVGRMPMQIKHLHSPVENFSLSFDQMKDACVLYLRWEDTEASVLLAEKK